MDKQIKIDKKRLSSIDILKGICIIFVIITHFSWKDEERLIYLFPFWIGMAIPIFMVLSGYVNALSYRRHNINNIENAYELKNIYDKFIRFTIPFLIVFLFDGIVSKDFHVLKKDGPLRLLYAFARGGYGAGSYYYPFLIQFIFIFPIIYFIIDKYDLKGYICCGLINLIYEFAVRAYGVNLRTYRIVVLRYIWVISFGVFLAIGKKRINKITYAIMMAVGSVYIVLVLYFGERPFITKWWLGTNMWASLFIIPIIVLLVGVNISCPPMEMIGKSSYHIFLVQMCFYNHEQFFTRCFTKRYEKLLVNILICVLVGIMFYLIDFQISKAIRENITKGKKGVLQNNEKNM